MSFLVRRFWFFAVVLAALGQFAPFFGQFCPMQNLASPAQHVVAPCPACPQFEFQRACVPCCETTSGAVWASAPLVGGSKKELSAPTSHAALTSAKVVPTSVLQPASAIWQTLDLPPPRVVWGETLASRGPPGVI